MPDLAGRYQLFDAKELTEESEDESTDSDDDSSDFETLPGPMYLSTESFYRPASLAHLSTSGSAFVVSRTLMTERPFSLNQRNT
jgi:hypothetical protein